MGQVRHLRKEVAGKQMSVESDQKGQFPLAAGDKTRVRDELPCAAQVKWDQRTPLVP